MESYEDGIGTLDPILGMGLDSSGIDTRHVLFHGFYGPKLCFSMDLILLAYTWMMIPLSKWFATMVILGALSTATFPFQVAFSSKYCPILQGGPPKRSGNKWTDLVPL